MLDKDKQKLCIDSKNLRIFKLTFRNIYKFLKINWERFLFNNDVTMVTAILLNFIMGYSVLFWSARVETLATPTRWSQLRQVNQSILPTTMIFFLCSFVAKKKFFWQKAQIMNYELWIMNYELWIMNYELWIMNYELWIMNYELWIMKWGGGEVERWRGGEVGEFQLKP